MQPAIRNEQLQSEDRMTIAGVSQRNGGVLAIARMLRRAPLTISRELERDGSSSFPMELDFKPLAP